MTCIDGKMRSLLNGRGDSWCPMCNISREQAAGMTEDNLNLILEFKWGISHSYEETQRIRTELKRTNRAGIEVIQKRKEILIQGKE